MLQIVQPRAALALALWLQAKAPDGCLGHDIHARWQSRSLVVELTAPRAAELSAWTAAFQDLLVQQEPQRLVFRPSAFAPPPEPPAELTEPAAH